VDKVHFVQKGILPEAHKKFLDERFK